MTAAKKRYTEPVLPVLCALVLALLTLVLYGSHYKQATVILCTAAAAFCILRRKSGSFNWASAALAVYILICAVSGIGAVSGKFFLKEFSKLLMAYAVFLVILFSKDRKAAVTLTAYILSLMAAVFALFSVELGCTAVLRPLFDLLTGLVSTETGFEEGVRLIGVFGNANVLASVMALGALLSVHLLVTDDERLHVPCGIALSFCVFCFVLAFSLGGTAFFALSCLLYLFLSGKNRGAVLLVMLDHFIPAAIFAFGAFPFLGSNAAPVALMLLCSALNLCIFRFVHPRLLSFFSRGRNALLILLSAFAAAAIYIISALSVTGAYRFDSEGFLRRSTYLEPGKHTVTVVSDGTVGLNIFSQTNAEIITQTRSQQASRWMKNEKTIQFTVPEGSQVQQFVMWAKEGVTIKSVTIDGETPLKLDYKLLPDFIVNRLQGVLKNQNAVQRTVFFADGLKLFRQSPLLGNGLGSFESAACSVQSYYYETRYIHNHYIQILTDCGIPGLLAYLALLALLIIRLIKHRGETFAVLAAYLFMIAGHSLMEVTMSMTVYLPFAFGIFAMIAIDGEPSGKSSVILNWLSAGLYAVFAVLIALNLHASAIVDKAETDDEFMAALEKAAVLDVFEHNDYKVSYVYNSLFFVSEQTSEKAEQYAAELSTVRSNSISSVLLRYYLETQQYDKAFDCAMFGAQNNRSDSSMWNEYFGLMSFYLTPSKLDSGLVGQVMEFYAAFEEASSCLLTPLTLTKDSISYIQAVSALVS